MCEQPGAVITWKNSDLPLQNRYRLLEEEYYKSGNTGVLNLGHSSLDITQEISVVSER